MNINVDNVGYSNLYFGLRKKLASDMLIVIRRPNFRYTEEAAACPTDLKHVVEASMNTDFEFRFQGKC